MFTAVTPRAFMIAETTVNQMAIDNALQHLGLEKPWRTDATDDHALLTEFAGKSCYMSFDESMNQNLTKTGTRNNHDYIQQGIIGNHHGSVLEHSTVTFFLVDVSRVVTHELVRHRAGVAISQTSGRYVRSNDVRMYMPNDIACNEEAAKIFLDAMTQMGENMRKLAVVTQIDAKPFGLKKRLTSAFRRLIGNGQANNIVVTANHRAWRHMIEMRTDPHAEEEIRVIFAEISRQLRGRFTALYADAIITTVDGIEVTKFEHSKV